MEQIDSTTLLTEHDVSKRLNITVSALRRWRLEGRGPRFRKLGVRVRYLPEDVEGWIKSRPAGGEKGKPNELARIIR